MSKITDLEEKIKELETKAKPFRDELKVIDSDIKSLKKELEEAKKNVEYEAFEPILKDYYTFTLPRKKGEDWTDLTGWHGGNTREMSEKLEKMFDGFEPYERHIEFDVMCTVFEQGLIENFLEEVPKNVVKSLNIIEVNYKKTPKLKNFEGIEEYKDIIIDFIERYMSIKVNSCIHDW